MTNRYKDFGYGKVVENQEPLKFSLHGEEFECVPQIQGKVMLDLVASSSADDAGATAKVIGDFFGKVLRPESYKRFDALINDQDKIVSIEALSEIVSWLVGEYSGRPNPQPED
ncbi:MAG: hypothetical protein ACRC5T_03715 [Cetobacterium sp.]